MNNMATYEGKTRQTYLVKKRGLYKDIKDIVRELGKCCIKDQLYRGTPTDQYDNDFNIFDPPFELFKDEFKVVPKKQGTICGGYMFLDRELLDDDLYNGCVRLYCGNKGEFNPKFTFWVSKSEPNVVNVEWA